MNIGAIIGGMGGLTGGTGASAPGMSMAGANPNAAQNPWGIDSLMKALGGMGGGQGGQQGQAGAQEQKKKSLDALLMLAQILQQANATHNSTSLGGGMGGFGFGGGMR